MTIENAVLVNQAFRESERKRPSEAERLKSKHSPEPELPLEDRDPSPRLSKPQKQKIIEKTKNQTRAQAQKTVIKEIASITGKSAPAKRRAGSIGSIDGEWNEFRFFLNDEETELFQRLRSLLSHKTGEADINATFLRLISEGLDKHDPVKIEERSQRRRQAREISSADASEMSEFESSDTSRSQAENSDRQIKATKTIPAQESRQMWLNSGLCCSYIDPISQKHCESELFLDRDHRVPKSKGGGNHASNLAPMCSTHNRVVKGSRMDL